MRKYVRTQTRLNPPRVDFEIKAESVTVIDEQGRKLGIMLLADAVATAHKKGYQLLELAPGVGRFGKATGTALTSTTGQRQRPTQKSLERLKREFQPRLTNVDWDYVFPTRTEDGIVWFPVDVMMNHLIEVMKIPETEITRKQVELKKAEVQKEITLLQEELSKLESSKHRQIIRHTKSPASEKDPALVAITVSGRQILAAEKCGPSVCLGVAIGNDPTEAYVGMWWKNHVWAFAEHNGRNLNFKTRRPENDEVVGYNNSRPTVSPETEAQARKIALEWMPESARLARSYNATNRSTADKISQKLREAQFTRNVLRQAEDYFKWLSKGKPTRLSLASPSSGQDDLEVEQLEEGTGQFLYGFVVDHLPFENALETYTQNQELLLELPDPDLVTLSFKSFIEQNIKLPFVQSGHRYSPFSTVAMSLINRYGLMSGKLRPTNKPGIYALGYAKFQFYPEVQDILYDVSVRILNAYLPLWSYRKSLRENLEFYGGDPDNLGQAIQAFQQGTQAIPLSVLLSTLHSEMHEKPKLSLETAVNLWNYFAPGPDYGGVRLLHPEWDDMFIENIAERLALDLTESADSLDAIKREWRKEGTSRASKQHRRVQRQLESMLTDLYNAFEYAYYVIPPYPLDVQHQSDQENAFRAIGALLRGAGDFYGIPFVPFNFESVVRSYKPSDFVYMNDSSCWQSVLLKMIAPTHTEKHSNWNCPINVLNRPEAFPKDIDWSYVPAFESPYEWQSNSKLVSSLLVRLRDIIRTRELEYFHGPYTRAQLNPFSS